MRYLTLDEILALHRAVLEQSGGAEGIHDLGSLESAVAQPYMAFGGEEFYPTTAEKAAALAFSLVMNHAFVDGNKRIGHAAMESMLVLNGYELIASVDEQEKIISELASSRLSRGQFNEWVRVHVVEKR